MPSSKALLFCYWILNRPVWAGLVISKREEVLDMVLGIPDFWIWSAFLLCIACTLLCVIYGAINWNRGGNDESKQIEEEKQWDEKEKEVVDKL
jgi:hypothetical protein